MIRGRGTTYWPPRVDQARRILSLNSESPKPRPRSAGQEKRTCAAADMHCPPVACTPFQFRGVNEYLKGPVTRIEAPPSNDGEIVFNTPQLVQFISRTPRLKAPMQAHAESCSTEIPRGELVDWQLSSLL